jgi:hypothetical protein
VAASSCGVRALEKLQALAPRLDPISQKTFIAEHAHSLHHALDTRRQKFFAQAGQRGRVGTPEQVGRDREIQFVD